MGRINLHITWTRDSGTDLITYFHQQVYDASRDVGRYELKASFRNSNGRYRGNTLTAAPLHFLYFLRMFRVAEKRIHGRSYRGDKGAVWGVLGTESYDYLDQVRTWNGFRKCHFRASPFQNFWGSMPADPPSDSRLQRSFFLPPHTQISSYGHGIAPGFGNLGRVQAFGYTAQIAHYAVVCFVPSLRA